MWKDQGLIQELPQPCRESILDLVQLGETSKALPSSSFHVILSTELAVHDNSQEFHIVALPQNLTIGLNLQLFYFLIPASFGQDHELGLLCVHG